MKTNLNMKKLTIYDESQQSVASDRTEMKDELSYTAICEKYNRLDALHTDLAARYKEAQNELSKCQAHCKMILDESIVMSMDLNSCQTQYERIVQEKADMAIELGKLKEVFEEVMKHYNSVEANYWRTKAGLQNEG